MNKRFMLALSCLLIALLLTGCGASSWVCSGCHEKVEGGDFCTSCGGKKAEQAQCAACEFFLTESYPSYCPKCGAEFQNKPEMDGTYAMAIEAMNAEKYEEAKLYLILLEGYKDSKELMVKCDESIPVRDYQRALKLKQDAKYTEAIEAFKALGDYQDCAAQIAECNDAIKGERYNEATALLESGKHKEAYRAFSELKGFKDVDKLLSENPDLVAVGVVQAEKVAPFKEVGNYVTFGQYYAKYHSKKSNRGSEPIEWIVLEYDAETNRAKLLSRYCLDRHYFDRYDTSAFASSVNGEYQGWDQSEIRKWLNGEFMRTAFTQEEQDAIATTLVVTDDNDLAREYAKAKNYSNYRVKGGEPCEDKLFLLSISEVLEMAGMSSISQVNQHGNAKLVAELSTYAAGQRFSSSKDDPVFWWLRSPGATEKMACYVGGPSGVFRLTEGYGSHYVGNNDIGVRPALWLDLDQVPLD